MKKELYYFWRVLITPSCWVRCQKTNKPWDRALRRVLEKPVFTNASQYHAELNGYKLWVENFPYAYATDDTNKIKGMPTRRTVFMIHDALSEHLTSHQ